MPRFLAALALAAAMVLFPSAPAAAPGDVLDEPLRALERHAVLSRGEAVSIGNVVERVVAGEEPVAQGAAAISPGNAVAGAARAAVLWLLGVGGAASAVAAGWRHVQRRNALDHPTRVALLALIRRQPGLHLRALARATAQPVQRAAYHLQVLERLGLVASQRLGGRRCYHEAGVAPEVRRALLEAAALPGPAARDVLAFIATHPGASQSEVARQLGMLPGRARWHLRRLAAQGALVEAREGKARTYRPPPLNSGPRP